MSNDPHSPGELIRLRFEWLAAGAFDAIYRSYHADARFRGYFPSEEEYVRFAREQHLDRLELLQLEVLDQSSRGNLARVLSLQVYRLKGEKFRYLDITSLRFDGAQWQVLSGKRCEVSATVAPDDVSWSSVENDPGAIEY